MIEVVDNNKRIAWIDIAKGLGILFVVIGHVRTISFIHDWIYLFHMPLFFLLSGIVFKVDEHWMPCIRKKVIHLLLPYVFFMVLLVPLRYVTDYFCTGEWATFRLSMLGLSYFDKPLWFIFALFIVIAVMRTLFSYVKSKIIIVMTVILLSIFGYILLLHKIELPIHVSRAFFVLPFFAFGILFKKYQSDNSVKMVLLSTLCFALGIWGLLTGHVCLDTLKMQIDNNPLFVYFPAFGGSMLVLYASKGMSLFQLRGKIEKKSKISQLTNSIFAYLGRNSFYVFAVHHPFICFLNSIFYSSMTETVFSPCYAILLIITSTLFSLSIGFILKKSAPKIFR